MKDLKITFESLADIGKGFMIDFTKVNLNNVSSGTDSNQTNNSSNNQNNNGNTTNGTTNTGTPSNTSTDTTSNTSQDDDTDNSDNSSNTDNNSGIDNSNSNTDTNTSTDTNTDTSPNQVALNNTVVVKFKDDVTITVDGLTVRTDSSSKTNLRNSLKPLVDKGILPIVYHYSNNIDDYKSIILYNNTDTNQVIRLNYTEALNDENWLDSVSPKTSYKLLGDSVEVTLAHRTLYSYDKVGKPFNSVGLNKSIDDLPMFMFINDKPSDSISLFPNSSYVYLNNTDTDQNVRMFFPLGVPNDLTIGSANTSVFKGTHNVWFDLSKREQANNNDNQISPIGSNPVITKVPKIVDNNLTNAYLRFGMVSPSDIYLSFARTNKMFESGKATKLDKYSNPVTTFNITNLMGQNVIDDYDSRFTGGARDAYTKWTKPANLDYFISNLSNLVEDRDGLFYFAVKPTGLFNPDELHHPLYPVDLPSEMTLQEFAQRINNVLREKYYYNMVVEVDYFTEDPAHFMQSNETNYGNTEELDILEEG